MALMVSHIFLRAAGSTPVVGSSNNITFGLRHQYLRQISVAVDFCPVRKMAPSNESKSDIELPLIAATVLATGPIKVLGQVDEAGELLQLHVDPVFRASETSDPREEGQHLSACQHLGGRRVICDKQQQRWSLDMQLTMIIVMIIAATSMMESN